MQKELGTHIRTGTKFEQLICDLMKKRVKSYRRSDIQPITAQILRDSQVPSFAKVGNGAALRGRLNEGVLIVVQMKAES